MRPLASFIDNLIKPALIKNGLAQTKIFTEWHLIIGEKLAEYSLPKKLICGKGVNLTNTLYVEVSNSSINTEIYYLEDLILEKIATYFGYKAVTKLKVIVNPSIKPSTPFKPAVRKLNSEQQERLFNEVSFIEDDELKTAFFKLGSHIIN